MNKFLDNMSYLDLHNHIKLANKKCKAAASKFLSELEAQYVTSGAKIVCSSSFANGISINADYKFVLDDVQTELRVVHALNFAKESIDVYVPGKLLRSVFSIKNFTGIEKFRKHTIPIYYKQLKNIAELLAKAVGGIFHRYGLFEYQIGGPASKFTTLILVSHNHIAMHQSNFNIRYFGLDLVPKMKNIKIYGLSNGKLIPPINPNNNIVCSDGSIAVDPDNRKIYIHIGDNSVIPLTDCESGNKWDKIIAKLAEAASKELDN